MVYIPGYPPWEFSLIREFSLISTLIKGLTRNVIHLFRLFITRIYIFNLFKLWCGLPRWGIFEVHPDIFFYYFILFNLYRNICGTNTLSNNPAAQAAGTDPANATPPVGQIHPCSKNAVTNTLFWCPSRFRISEMLL